jgi:hypothetical protein
VSSCIRVGVPVVGIRKLDDLDILDAHVVEHQHVQDAVVLGDAPPVGLQRVQALRQADALALQVAHLVDAVLGPHQHAAAFVGGRRAQQPGAADVGLDVDRRVQAAEADQVVEVVDVVRVPVVLAPAEQVGVIDTERREVGPAPGEFLIDVAGRDHAAVGVEDFLPVQLDGAQCLALKGRCRHLQLLC